MYNGIRRNSGLFSPEVSDELNNAFSLTLDKIEKFPVQYKEKRYPVSIVDASSTYPYSNFSFAIDGKEFHILMYINIPSDISAEVRIATIAAPDCFGSLLSKNERYPIQIVNGFVSITKAKAGDYILVGNCIYDRSSSSIR